MIYESPRALQLLRIATQIQTAEFRDGQEEAIQHVVEGRGRLLVVQRTGWGKSFVYFIATKVLRENGAGVCLLISPLLALMRNQILAAERMGLRAASINSENEEMWTSIEESLATDEVDVLLVSPERLANQRFREQVLSRIAPHVSLMVVDEAHCISDWGHDFRPHYRLLKRLVTSLPSNMRLLGTTATANDRVVEDLRHVLGPSLHIVRGDLNRPSLRLVTLRVGSQSERMAWLAENLPALPGSGIVYALTIRDAEAVAHYLSSTGTKVEPYHAKLDSEERVRLEQALSENLVKALVATTALGMGYDKPDLGFVIHFQAPGSVISYYQQVGRAGRAVDAAYGILLSGDEDSRIIDYFIDSAFPTPDEVGAVLRALESHEEGLSSRRMLRHVNMTLGRIEKALTLLSLEQPAPVVEENKVWQLTAAEVSPSFWERAERLTELRRREKEEMQQYIDLDAGHMEFLMRALDGGPAPFSPPDLPDLPGSVDAAAVSAAEEFLRGRNLPIEPRARWPVGGLPHLGQKGRIAEEHRMEEGRALCRWADSGWGREVRAGKYENGRFSDDLVDACVELLEKWSPEPSPAWVTAIPSTRSHGLVPNFGRRLATRLGIRFVETLERCEDRPRQREMANSVQQAINVDGAFWLRHEDVPDGAVLLVDDVVDSRWTLTVAAFLLRRAGSGKVWPLVLADGSRR